MVTMVAIARTELLRLLRDRSNLFFVFVFPLLLVVLIGSVFGEGAMDTRIGVTMPDDDAAAERVVQRLERSDGIVVDHVATDDELREGVSRGATAIGLALPEGFGAALADGVGAEVGFVTRPDAATASLSAVVEAALNDEAAVAGAAHSAAELTGQPVGELLDLARTVERAVPDVEVAAVEVGDDLAEEFAGLGQFDLGASSQLFLFTFLTALTAGAALIQTRQLGVARRMAATATPMRVILGGEAAGRVLVALTQAAYIIVASWLLFRVDWGDPLATGVVVVLFSLVAGGAGMLLGATASNDSQAAGVGVGGGLALAALGGSMLPIEIFPETMRTIAHVTPHAWANRAMAEILRRDGGLTDVLLELAVLAAFAIVLLTAATWQLRRALIR